MERARTLPVIETSVVLASSKAALIGGLSLLSLAPFFEGFAAMLTVVVFVAAFLTAMTAADWELRATLSALAVVVLLIMLLDKPAYLHLTTLAFAFFFATAFVVLGARKLFRGLGARPR